MARHITIIHGHPDPDHNHYGYALVQAYADGAATAGHEVKRIEVAQLDFPLLRTKDEFDNGVPPPCIVEAQHAITWADLLVFCYPLWFGSMPALLKGFLEQTLRPGFAVEDPGNGRMWKKLLKGKSARIIVTMGMPSFFYRWYYRAHSLKSLERNILEFSGVHPVKATLIGMVEYGEEDRRQQWLEKLAELGRQGK